MKPKILMIDADDTIFDFKRAEREAICSVLRLHNLPITPEVLDKYSTINLQLWKALEVGEITRGQLFTLRFSQLLEYIRQEAAWHEEWELADADWESMDGAVFNEKFLDALGEQSFLQADAEAVIRDLQDEFVWVLVTNGVERVQRSRLAASPLAPYIKRLFISEALGVEKPDARFFELALAELGNPDKQEVLIIGDSLTADIRGGNNAGIRTCWYNPFNLPLPEGEEAPIPDYAIESLRELPALLSII